MMQRGKGYVDEEYLQKLSDYLASNKQYTYALMEVRSGDKVLDVGCGPATDTIPLAKLVGSEGKVFGVDNDPEMLVKAEERAKEENVSEWTTHNHADAGSLPFEAGYFDSCRSERLFQHLENPAKALSEMVRVTKPGGRVVLFDADWGTLSIDTSEVVIERKLLRFLAGEGYHNGYAGRQLYRLFRQENLRDISVEVIGFPSTDYALTRQTVLLDRHERNALNAGVVTKDELRRWHENLEKADEEGCFFSSVCMMLLAGKKPETS